MRCNTVILTIRDNSSLRCHNRIAIAISILFRDSVYPQGLWYSNPDCLSLREHPWNSTGPWVALWEAIAEIFSAPCSNVGTQSFLHHAIMMIMHIQNPLPSTSDLCDEPMAFSYSLSERNLARAEFVLPF